MQRVLRRRIFRELKANWSRYIALGFLITLCMYIVISLIGAAEIIIQQSAIVAEENKIEDGEFSVFIPLTEVEVSELEDEGVTLEKQFYLDFSLNDNTKIRIFKNREKINLIEIEEGNKAENENEIVLEKRYAQLHMLKVGGEIEIANKNYKIVGIATAPDYEAVLNKVTDASVDSEQFGLGWVCDTEYELLKKSMLSLKTEENVYAYRLNGEISNEDLKERIKELGVDAEEVEDEFFKEYWEETVGAKDEVEKGIDDLADGTKELLDGLEEIESHNLELTDATSELFEMYLKEANEGFKGYGLSNELTEANFEEELDKLMEEIDSSVVKLKIDSIIEDLNSLKEFKDGIEEYTTGVSKATDGMDELNDGMLELNNETDDIIEEIFGTELSNLTQFLPAEDNPRIGAAASDKQLDKVAGLIAGAIVIMLITYVISVFVVHNIESETSIIGALYALGVKSNDLLKYYLLLPVIITFVGGGLGGLLGLSHIGIDSQLESAYGYFSLPEYERVLSPYLLIYSLIMPPVLAIVVNLLVIRKKLNRPVLKLIRNEQKQKKSSNIDLKNMTFIGRFRIRQMIRELRSSFAVVFGMFIALLIYMMGCNSYVLCNNIKNNNVADTKYEYMYTYKYPEEEVPANAEAAYSKSLEKEIYGCTHDVTVLGIDEENPYFNTKLKKGKSIVNISSAMAEKFAIKEGDKLILTDSEDDRDYAFTVNKICEYSSGFYAFMDIDCMRELFDVSDDYYNVVFSSEELNIDAGRLYAKTSIYDIKESAAVFSENMGPLFTMLFTVSIIIFVVVMYLMMKVMIERSAFSISLIKIFGYRTKEIQKLYLNGNFYVIAIGALMCIPCSKKVMDMMYPMMISNVSCGMDLEFPWQLYVGTYCGIIGLYFIINNLLVRKLNKMLPAEVLKNRE